MTDELQPTTVTEVATALKAHETADKKLFAEVQKKLKEKSSECEDDEGEIKMQEPVNVFTNGYPGVGAINGVDGMGSFGGILIGALLAGGLGGFGNRAALAADAHGSVEDCIMNNQNLATIMGGITNATNAITSGQRQDLGTIMSGQQAILAGVNNDTLTTNLAICNQGDRLSTLIGEQAGSIRAEISEAKLQSAEQFAAAQLQAANNTFALSRQMCDDAKEGAAQFAALSLQACQNQNALQMQIAECCCETQTAIAAANTARIQDELDALRLERALAAANAGNGQVINQIAVSLGAITQTLAALQTKLPA